MKGQHNNEPRATQLLNRDIMGMREQKPWEVTGGKGWREHVVGFVVRLCGFPYLQHTFCRAKITCSKSFLLCKSGEICLGVQIDPLRCQSPRRFKRAKRMGYLNISLLNECRLGSAKECQQSSIVTWLSHQNNMYWIRVLRNTLSIPTRPSVWLSVGRSINCFLTVRVVKEKWTQ